MVRVDEHVVSSLRAAVRLGHLESGPGWVRTPGRRCRSGAL